MHEEGEGRRAGAGEAPSGPMARAALPEAAVLRALGHVVRSRPEGPFPLQLAGTQRLGVHLVFCNTGRVVRGPCAPASGDSDGLPQARALPGA